jgi:hypothetical protein
MWRREWEIFGGICVALVVFGFVKHVYYVIKNVWPVKRVLDKPQRILPVPGPVTLNGIVSSIGDKIPVQVTIVEHGIRGGTKGQRAWRQMSYHVEAHPFALLLPELGLRIGVEPGDRIRLRAAGTATDWEFHKEVNETRRVRTSMLEDGDRAILTGMLEEKRKVELIATEYRSQKENVRIEYVLKPVPDKGITIDSETLLHEIHVLLGPLGWVRAIGTAVLVPAYVYALSEGFSMGSNILFAVLLVIVVFVRLGYMDFDRLPWFDRPNNPKKPYQSSENLKPVDAPWWS